MTKDAFKERERALEEEFFHRVDKKLLVDLPVELAAAAERERLTGTTGFGDQDVLSKLVALGVSTEGVAAISLVPLVLVAWTPNKMGSKERPLILKAAREQGIADDSAAPNWRRRSTARRGIAASSEKCAGATLCAESHTTNIR